MQVFSNSAPTVPMRVFHGPEDWQVVAERLCSDRGDQVARGSAIKMHAWSLLRPRKACPEEQ